MSASILKDCKLWLGKYDLSGYTNKMSLKREIDKVDATVFGCATRKNLPGLESVSFTHEGLASAATLPLESDDILAAYRAVASVPMTVAPLTGAAGEVCHFTKSIQFEYETGMEIGQLWSFTVSGEGYGHPLVLGTILENAAKTATGAGTALQLGAVTASQYLYASLHITAVSGTNPTLDLLLTSDDAVGMASATTRITFAQATAAGYQYATPVVGAITDDWWQASYTIGGTSNPSFSIVLAVGIR